MPVKAPGVGAEDPLRISHAVLGSIAAPFPGSAIAAGWSQETAWLSQQLL